MSDRSLGVVMNGVTGRMGHRQHLVRSVLAIRAAGGVLLSDGTRVQIEPVLVGRNERKLREIAESTGVSRWTTDLAAALSEPDMDVYFDAQLTSVRDAALVVGNARRQARVHREAPVRDARRSARADADRARMRRQERRRARQALPARTAQAQAAHRRRLLRVDPLGARRVRLLGLRGRLAGRPAPQLELPGRGRWRDRARHVLPLELRAREPVRLRRVGDRPGGHAHPAALGRGPPCLRRRRRRCGLRDLRARGRRDRAAELLVVRTRAPRRAARVPGRRHPRKRRRRPPPLRHPAPRQHAPADVEPRRRQHGRVSRAVAAGARQHADRQRVQAAVGAVRPARRRGRTASRTTSRPARVECVSPRPRCCHRPRGAGSISSGPRV